MMKIAIGAHETAVKVHGVAGTPEGHLVLHGTTIESHPCAFSVAVELSHAEQDMIDALRLPLQSWFDRNTVFGWALGIITAMFIALLGRIG